MARSLGRDGGNLFVASSKKTTLWRSYCFGSSVVAWSLVVALAHSWAKFVFANSSFFCHCSCHSCHASGTVSKLIALSIVLFAQSMWGFEFCSQGNPKIALSRPRFVTYNLSRVAFSPHQTWRIQALVIVPFLFSVLSAFTISCAYHSFHVGNLQRIAVR